MKLPELIILIIYFCTLQAALVRSKVHLGLLRGGGPIAGGGGEERSEVSKKASTYKTTS